MLSGPTYRSEDIPSFLLEVLVLEVNIACPTISVGVGSLTGIGSLVNRQRHRRLRLRVCVWRVSKRPFLSLSLKISHSPKCYT